MAWCLAFGPGIVACSGAARDTTAPDSGVGVGANDATAPRLGAASPDDAGPDARDGPDTASPGDASARSDQGTPPDPGVEGGDVLTTHVEFNLAARTATARISVRAPEAGPIVLDTGDLEIVEVRDGTGPIEPFLDGGEGGRLTWIAPAGEMVALEIDYAFRPHNGFQGLLAHGRSTLTWPTHCGNLFPCHAGPADGVLLKATVTGLEPGDVAIVTPELPTPAPAFVLAFAVGPYSRKVLGRSEGGVELVAFTRSGDADPVEALSRLPEVFSFYERHLGPYPFGLEAGPVAVDWGPVAVGGMEHHPYWHVSGALTDLRVQAHEAAHGWFGDGVRPMCWEDEVLSEGVADYLAAAALETLNGETELWATYRAQLEEALPRTSERRGRPPGCGEINPSGPWFHRQIPYKRGALFLRAVALRTSNEAVLRALGLFFRANVGRAAGVGALLDALAQTGFDATACAGAWLYRVDVPAAGPCAD